MGDSFVNSFVVLCCSSSYSHSLPFSAAAFTKLSAEAVSDTPLSPSHAGGKGDSAQENTGLRPVDAVVLPRPSSPRKGREEGKASVSVPSKENTNTTTVSSVQIANASIARASDQLFGFANFSSDTLTGVRSLPSLCSASNASTEENPTFKWYKRTLYQLQNLVEVVIL